MPRSLIALLVLAAAPAIAGEPPPPAAQAAASHAVKDTWAPLRFLVGEWVGEGSGKPGEGLGGFTFAPELGGKVLVRKNWSSFPPKPGEMEGTRHEDLMVVFPAGGALKATYWDNEGHVIQYTVTTEADRAIFESDEAPGAPRFKLVYEAQKDKRVKIQFLVAPPGKTYQPYITATARPKKA